MVALRALLLTEEIAQSDVRHTEDVDLIVHVASVVDWYSFQRRLTRRGFTLDDAEDGAPVCAMSCGTMRVDFMPDEAAILGFTNRWYRDALQCAWEHSLDGLAVRYVSPIYFLATKFEAFRGRGQGDILSSRDIEDIIVLIDGRSSLMSEIQGADPDLREYIIDAIGELVKNEDFPYLVPGNLNGHTSRITRVNRRLTNLASGVIDD